MSSSCGDLIRSNINHKSNDGGDAIPSKYFLEWKHFSARDIVYYVGRQVLERTVESPIHRRSAFDGIEPAMIHSLMKQEYPKQSNWT